MIARSRSRFWRNTRQRDGAGRKGLVVIDHIDEQWGNDFAGARARRHQPREAGHGREETRTYIQMPVPDDLPGPCLWAGLRSIGVAVSECIRDGEATSSARRFRLGISRHLSRGERTAPR